MQDLAAESPGRDAFASFGIARTLDLDPQELERRYLKLSRECHPDLNRSQNAADCIAVLQRSAEINDAWQVLRDPWRRARALLEAVHPGVLERNKRLDPLFLASALELAEEVAFAKEEAREALTRRLRARLDDDFAALRTAVAAGDFDGAARIVHQSHYHQKALKDLEARS